MAPFTKEAGSASALMGALQMGFGSLASAVVGMLNAQTPLPMASVMATCTCIGLVILLAGRRKIRHQIRREDLKEETLDLIEKC